MTTLDDLQTALSDTLATGKIGTPVSLRLHLQLTEPDADLFAAMSAVMQMIEPVFSSSSARLRARQDADARQLNVLLDYTNGETVLLTLGRGCAKQPSLNLLVVGNHGVVRLEGGEMIEESAGSTTSSDGTHWKHVVETSLASGSAVVFA
jgi:hypothetical protein